MKSRLPFPTPVGGNNLTLFDGDLSQTGDKEFTGKNDYHYPYRAKALLMSAEKDERRGGENLVCNRVEQFAKRGNEAHLACEVAVQKVGYRGDGKSEEGDSIAHLAPLHEADDKDRSENQTRDCKGVWEIQGRHCGGKRLWSPTPLAIYRVAFHPDRIRVAGGSRPA